MAKEKKVRITVTVHEKMYKDLRNLAESTDRTVPGYIRFLIAEEIFHQQMPQTNEKQP